MHLAAFQAGGDSREPKGQVFACPRMVGARGKHTQTLKSKIDHVISIGEGISK